MKLNSTTPYSGGSISYSLRQRRQVMQHWYQGPVLHYDYSKALVTRCCTLLGRWWMHHQRPHQRPCSLGTNAPKTSSDIVGAR
jgi:hypothetical protein